MIKNNFLKKVHNALTIFQNFNDFRAKLEPLKNGHPDTFRKIHIKIRSHPS